MSGYQVKAPRLLHLIQGLDFPPYEYVEYPKMVKSANEVDSKGLPLMVTVNSKAEEEAALKKKEPALAEPPLAEPLAKPTAIYTAPKP